MFHVGNARSALFNWVLTRQSGGTMVLRIKDTDMTRNRPEWVQGIIDAMAWLGIGPEEYEGPVFQSDHTRHHRRAIDRLLAARLAYHCGCSRQQALARTGDEHGGYDGFCRERGLPAGDGRAVRFRTPDDGSTVIVDLVRGKPRHATAGALRPHRPRSASGPAPARHRHAGPDVNGWRRGWRAATF